MDKGITTFFGYDGDIKERLKRIKQAGFSCIITSADKKFKNQNGTLKKQVKIAKKLGLKLSSLHSSYVKSELKYFFKDSKIGDKIENQLKKEVKIAKKYGFTCLVVHLNGKPNIIGIHRLNRILKVCEKYDLPLAIENIDAPETFNYVFENINNKYLCFCYDSGHNHVFERKRNHLKEFGNKLVAIHLSDNNGTCDQHTLNQFGSINWKKVAQQLKQANTVSLDYEIMLNRNPINLSEEEALQKCYENACKLEKLIKE